MHGQRSSFTGYLLSGLVISGVLARAATATATESRSSTVYFPHADSAYLDPNQHDGGAVLVPRTSETAPLPLIVFLHGTNPTRAMHLWLGGGGHDLRPVADHLYQNKKLRKFILAGPSQTRAASQGSGLWQAFDLYRFVDDVAVALAGHAKIDRSVVILLGHSGAGCSDTGGLNAELRPGNNPLPIAVVAVDPCMNGRQGRAFARRPEQVPLWLMWQPRVWPRDPAAFLAALSETKPVARVDRVERLMVGRADPHNTILPIALSHVVHELLAIPERDLGAS